MAHAAHDFYPYNGLAPRSNRTDGHSVYPQEGDPSFLPLNEYTEKFKKLHERAVQRIRDLTVDSLAKDDPEVAATYATRRRAQADKWLDDIMNECRLHAAWLAKGSTSLYDKKLEDFEHRLDLMDLYGRFDWVSAFLSPILHSN